VDAKFAPVSVTVALFGGSSTALSFVLVGMFLLAGYSIFRTFTAYMGLSLGAALAAAAVFFLNGFALCNLNLAIGQPYFLAPLLLHAMLIFSRHQTPRNAVLAIAANAALLSTTFTPTAVMAFLTVYAITLSLSLGRSPDRKVRLGVILAAVPAVSLLLLGFLYLPIFDAFGTYLRTIQTYNARRTPGISLINLLSLFTPKHFWESYGMMRLPLTAPAGPYNKLTFHLGVIGPLIAAHSLSRLKRPHAPVILAAAACFSASVGQIFGIFPFTLIDKLPFFSFVMNDYWFCMACLSLVVLVAYGYDAICETNAFNYVSMLLAGIILGSFVYLYFYLGLWGHFEAATDFWTKRYIKIFGAIVAAALVLLVSARRPGLAKWIKPLLLICLIGEGVYYMDFLRPDRSNRDEQLPESIVWLKSAVDRHPGSRVLDIGRNGVFPNWGSAVQIPELGLLSFGMSWYERFYHQYVGSDMFLAVGASPATTTYTFSDASLSLVGVRYVIADTGNPRALDLLAGLGYQVVHRDAIRLIFENPHALARSFAVRKVWTLDGLPSDAGESVSESATTNDQTLLSEVKRLGIPVDASEGGASSPDAVQVTSYHHDRIDVHCSLSQAALIVLVDAWNPRWSATVDRKPAYIGKVDVAFRGIAVAAGQHEIEFRYYPPSRLFGQLISAATLLGLLVRLWFWNKSLASHCHR
jgi:hypothetical protein